jgi:hypothetical protein
MKSLQLILPICLAILSWAAIPYAEWLNMTEGLLIFLGLLSAALVQVIPVTANFLQSEDLTVEDATTLTFVLEQQQKYWLGLLMVTVVTCFMLIVGYALPKEPISFSISVGGISFEPSIQAFYSGLVGGLVGLVVMKTFGFFPGVLSLQRLRGSLVIKAAKRRAAEKIEREERFRSQAHPVVPDDYGQIIHPPH